MSPLLKRHTRLSSAGVVDFRLINRYQIFFFLERVWRGNGQKQTNNNNNDKRIKADASAIWQHAAHTTDETSSPSDSALMYFFVVDWDHQLTN